MVSNVENGPSADTLFAAALKKHEFGDARTALRILFDLFRVSPFHKEGLKSAAKLSESLGSRQAAELFAAVADNPDDPQGLYDLGYAFVESALPELAASYLEACSNRRPEDHLVRYELAYARFRSGQYAVAVELLKPLAADPNLAGSESFGSRLLLVESLVHQGEISHARRIFELLEAHDADPHAESQLDAIASLLARAALFSNPAGLDQRDWHFIEHGGVLLHVAPGGALPIPTGIVSPEFLGGVLHRLSGLLRSLDLEPAEVQYLTPNTRPLARALARSMNRSAVPYAPHAHQRTLVVVREPSEAEPCLRDLRNHEDGVDLFALFADPRLEYPLHPEIVGLFANDLILPWTEPDNEASDAIRLAMSAIESQTGDFEALCQYYSPLREMLVLDNYDRYPGRRILTPLRVH